MKEVVIIGAGGFGREAAWVMERVNATRPTFSILGFSDDAPEKQRGTCGGRPLLGPIEKSKPGTAFFCAIGNNQRRKDATARAIACGLEPVSVFDPSAEIAPDAEIGIGSYIGIGSIVSVGSRLGAGTLVNHHVCVGHDVTTGDWCQFCPGVCISGGCTLGEGVLVATLSGMIPLKSAGSWCTIGAGTVPLRDVPQNATIIRLK